MDTNPGYESSLVLPVSIHDTERHDLVEGHAEQTLEVSVIFTDVLGTLAALEMARGLAQQLEGHVRLLMPYEVPYALPLTKPPVTVEFLEGQIRNLAGESRMEIAAEICLCRDKRRALLFLLRANTLIVVGGNKRWWPSPAQKLARALERDGHHVIFAELR